MSASTKSLESTRRGFYPDINQVAWWFYQSRSGRRSRSDAEGSLDNLWLVLNHTEAKKGRGIPEITKLRSQPHYLIQFIYRFRVVLT